MIDARRLSKRYGSRLVVDDLTLRVRQGDVLGFIGPNGAGKTTTMRMLSGVMPPYAGTVLIDGVDIAAHPREAKSRIGFLPENAPLYPTMTPRSFLKFAASLRGFRGKERNERIARVADLCDLRSVMDDEIESLSKGFRRRVCLAQSILHEPKALIMDEPTDGLDPNQKRQIRDLILSLRRNAAIIISTHILEEVEAVCSRVFLLCRGKALFDGTAEEFRETAREEGTDIGGLFARMTDPRKGCEA